MTVGKLITPKILVGGSGERKTLRLDRAPGRRRRRPDFLTDWNPFPGPVGPGDTPASSDGLAGHASCGAADRDRGAKGGANRRAIPNPAFARCHPATNPASAAANLPRAGGQPSALGLELRG